MVVLPADKEKSMDWDGINNFETCEINDAVEYHVTFGGKSEESCNFGDHQQYKWESWLLHS